MLVGQAHSGTGSDEQQNHDHRGDDTGGGGGGPTRAAVVHARAGCCRRGPPALIFTALRTGKHGNIFRVGIFLDFVRLTTRTMHPHGADARGAKRNRIDPHRGGSGRPTTRTPVAGTGVVLQTASDSSEPSTQSGVPPSHLNLMRTQVSPVRQGHSRSGSHSARSGEAAESVAPGTPVPSPVFACVVAAEPLSPAGSCAPACVLAAMVVVLVAVVEDDIVVVGVVVVVVVVVVMVLVVVMVVVVDTVVVVMGAAVVATFEVSTGWVAAEGEVGDGDDRVVTLGVAAG